MFPCYLYTYAHDGSIDSPNPQRSTSQRTTTQPHFRGRGRGRRVRAILQSILPRMKQPHVGLPIDVELKVTIVLTSSRGYASVLLTLAS